MQKQITKSMIKLFIFIIDNPKLLSILTDNLKILKLIQFNLCVLYFNADLNKIWTQSIPKLPIKLNKKEESENKNGSIIVIIFYSHTYRKRTSRPDIFLSKVEIPSFDVCWFVGLYKFFTLCYTFLF